METDFYSRLAFFLMILYLIMMRVCFNLMLKKRGSGYLTRKKSLANEGKKIFVFKVVISIILTLIIIGYLFNLRFVKIFTLSTLMLLKWTGFIIGGISLLFWTWAQLVLGNDWRVNYQLNENHKLITNGPYRKIRHPLYTAMIIWCIGISILTTNLIFIGFSLLSITFLLIRIPKEEKMLIDKFGNEYKEYIKRTGRFFPKIKRDSLNNCK
jgi:protein-S-isoprenylcysteine O-methyltransferase Ste14